MNSLISSVKENGLFVLEFLGIVVAIILVAYLFEKAAKKKRKDTERVLSTKKVVVIGVFSAISTVLFLFEIPVFFAPSFYKLDFSELPALICAFAYGPVAGVLVEFIKEILKCVVKGTSTAFVGELANFVVGCALILPASIVYSFKKTKKNAIVACVIGTVIITLVGTVFNAVYLIPAFAALFGMPLDSIISMGSAINQSVTDVWSLVFICVAPLNLIKGLINSIITVLIYKNISRFLKK